MKISKASIAVAATLALIFRLGFATILFLAASQVDSGPLRFTLLIILSAMTANGVYRAIRMFGYVKHAHELEKLYNNH